MAKGIKYRIEYKDFYDVDLKIDILFEGYSSSIIEIVGADEPFIKKTEQLTSDLIKGQVLESEYLIQGVTGNGFSLSDFTSENYGDIVFNYYKNAVLVYSGVIAPFESSQELAADGLTILSLSAETGIKQLYKETLRNEDDTHLSGRYKLIEILSKALRLLEVPNTFNIVSEVNTLVYIDGVQKNTTLDFFENYIDAEAFKLAPNTWMSAYETIEAILGGVYTLKLHESKWVISNYVDNTQASKYITTYNYLGVKQSRTSTAKVTRALSSQIVLKGGTEGKQFSKSKVEIKQNILSLVNRLSNPVFAYSSFDIEDWTNESSFSSVEHGGDGSNSNPYYFKINGSVYSPAGGSDTEYLESTAFSWNPLGTTDFALRDLAKYNDDNENLRFNLNSIHGTGISGSRVQIIATWSNLKNFSEQPTAVIADADPVYETVVYYFTNDGWSYTPGYYNTGNNDNEEIILTEPPVRLSTSLRYKALSLGTYYLETPPTVSVSIRIFRGERKKIGESTAEEVGYTYFVKYFALSSSVWTTENQNVLDIGSRIFTSDANTDREAKETIEYNIYGDVSPIAFGSLFETNVSNDAINGFKRLGGTTITDYTLFLAKTYLRGRDTRLSTLNITLFDNTTLESDLFTFEGKTYRIFSYEWMSRMSMHKLRIVEVSYSGSSISEVISEREFSEVIKAVETFDTVAKIKTIFAIDPNFIYTPSKGLQLNPYLDGISSFNPTGGFMNLLKEGNEDTTSINFIDADGLVTDYIKPSGGEFLLKGEGGIEATIATDATAWMLGATNVLTEKDYIGSASGAYDIGIKRAGTEIVTIKSTGVDIAGTLKISGLTASELTATDANKNLQSLDIATYPSLAEVSYVKGVTNSIQDQIDLKFNIASFTDVAVTSKLLTGLSISGTSVAATDSILVAVGKLQAQVTAQLGGLIFQSTWNATTNTPTITSSTGTKGHYYIVSTAGSTSIDGESDWKAKDWVVFNGTTWDKVDNTDSVSSVNGEVGAVSLTTDDITEGVTNLYYTDAAVRSAISESIIGIDYNNSTGIFSTSSGYGIPTTIKQGDWDTAYTLASSSWLLNGNTIGAKKTIGSLDAYDVGIIRGGTEVVTIGSLGATITGKITAASAAITGLTTNYLPKVGTAGLLGNSLIYDNGSVVAIGSTSPSASTLLQLTKTSNGASVTQLVLHNNSATDGTAANLDLVAFSAATVVTGRISNKRNTGGLYSLGLHNYIAGVGLTEVVRVDYIGNVGIGTVSPSFKAHIIGTTSTTSLNITNGAIVGYAWKCTNATTGAGAWESVATSERWMGTWDASSGSAPDATPTTGDYYSVTTAGTYSGVTYAVNDYSYWDGTNWVFRPNNYTLITATSSILGGIKIGTTLDISSGVADLKAGIATAGTYRSVTVDTYGRVTAGTNSTLAIADGGTGSATQNFVDLTTAQTIAGIKTFSVDAKINGVSVGRGGGNNFLNSALGAGALLNNTTGYSNTASGNLALFWNTTGYQNTANGDRALKDNTTGSQNTGIGHLAGSSITTGGNNTILGQNTGQGITTGSGNTILGYNINGLSATLSDTLIIGAGGRQDLIADATGFQYNGLLRPDGTAGTDGQFLGTDGTNDEWQTLTVANILETLTITNGSFSRELIGLHLAPTGTEAFFVGFDADSGIGVFRNKIWSDTEVFRNKIWSDTEEVTFVEHGFDIYESGRFGIVTEDGNFRHYAFLDEIESSGGTVGTLQTVTDNGAISTNRLQYLSGGETVNYALVSEIIEAQGLQAVSEVGANSTIRLQYNGINYATVSDISAAIGIDGVLAIGNVATNRTIEFKSDSSRDILQFKKLDNTLLGGLSMLQGTNNEVLLQNNESEIGVYLGSDGKAQFGESAGTFIEYDFLTTDTLSTKYNVGGVYKGGLEILNTGVLKMQAEAGLWINSSGNCVFNSTGMSIGTADYNIYINAEGSNIGDVYIGRASNGLDSKLELHGSAFNFWIASTPSDGQQAVFEYDGTLGKWLLKFIP